MTRDEAIQKFKYAANEGSFAVEAWIDRFAALGMITLDQSNDVRNRARDAILDLDRESRMYSTAIIEAIEKAGLKIVEA